MADILALSIFGRLISLRGKFILSSGFHMPIPALIGSHITSVSCLGGVIDPSV